MFGFDLRTAKITWTVFLVALLLFVAYLIRSTLLVVIFSIFFAYLLYPLVEIADRYRPRRMPRTAVIVLVFILVTAIVIVAGALFAFIVSFENLEMTLFLTAPGMTTLPISILQYLQYHIDPLVAAVAVAQVVLVGAALIVLDRQVRLSRVAV